MNERSGFMPVWRARYWILTIACVAGVVAYVLSARRADVYKAEASVRVESGRQAQGDLLTPDQQQALGQVYERIAGTGAVVDRGWAAAGRVGTESAYASNVEVSLENEVGVLTFTAKAGDPARAARMANGYARAFRRSVSNRQEALRRASLAGLKRRITETEARLRAGGASPAVRGALTAELQTLEAQVGEATTNQGDEAIIIDPATAPSAPAGPKPPRDAALAALAILLLGILAVYLRSQLVDRFQSVDEMSEALGLPVLGVVPLERGRKAVTEFQRVEAFRALRTALLLSIQRMREQAGDGGDVALGEESGTILVTSAEPGTGKTHITANLARALASGRSVAAVDADLRRPSLHARLGAPSFRGLGDFLSDPTERRLGSVAVSVGGEARGSMSGTLDLVAAGQADERAVERLSSARAREAFSQLEHTHALVLIDSPPIGTFSDALVLADHSDGIIFVVDERRTRRRAAHRAVELLRTARVPVIGIVVNRLSTSSSSEYGYGYGYSYDYADAKR